MHSALTIAGSDSSGGAGVQADLKAFAAVGVHGASVLTAVTAQSTTVVTRLDPLPPTSVAAQLEAVLGDLDVRAVKTGLLHGAATVDAVAQALDAHALPLVVDPVLVATSGDRLADDALVGALGRLAPHARLVTPNLDELAALAGQPVSDVASALEAAERLLDAGWPAVLVKGGHLPTPDALDVLVTPQRARELVHPRLVGPFHGAGCTLASLIAGLLARGHGLDDAVAEAVARTHRALERSLAVGAGPRVPNALDAVPPGDPAGAPLSAAVWRIAATLPLRLVPEVGINAAYLPGDGEAPTDVYGLSRRITRSAAGPTAPGPVQRGASGHVARVLLGARHVAPAITTAMNLAYDSAHLEAARAAGLETASFSREEEPPGAGSSMEWGTATALKASDAPVDLVFDAGGHGKEPMMRVLARSPEALADKVTALIAALEAPR